jgi:hypothetical protein
LKGQTKEFLNEMEKAYNMVDTGKKIITSIPNVTDIDKGKYVHLKG